jgi:hypothetical protein
MSGNRVVAVTVLVVLAVTLASGPLVGVSLTDDPAADGEPNHISVSVDEAPNDATLVADRHNDHLYHLRADPVYITASDVSGRPTVVYRVEVPELNHTRSAGMFVTEAGTYEVSFDPSNVDSERVEQDRYEGTVTVQAFDVDGSRVLVERTVTVEVDE